MKWLDRCKPGTNKTNREIHIENQKRKRRKSKFLLDFGKNARIIDTEYSSTIFYNFCILQIKTHRDKYKAQCFFKIFMTEILFITYGKAVEHTALTTERQLSFKRKTTI